MFIFIIDIWLVVAGRVFIFFIIFLIFVVRSWGFFLFGRFRTRFGFFIFWRFWKGFRARTGFGRRLFWFWVRFRTWFWMRFFTTRIFGLGTIILFFWWSWAILTSFTRWTGMWSWAAVTRRFRTGTACFK